MRIYLALLVFFSLSATAIAQSEFGGKTLSIPAGSGVTKPAATPSSSVPSSIFDNPKPSPSIPSEPINSNFGKTNEFANPNTSTLNALNGKDYREEHMRPARTGNQYLGELKTTSALARIVYRDYDIIDGDIIKVHLNGEVIMRAAVLDSEFRGFDITLQKGINRLEVEALSEGYGPPNTAEFELFDENGEKIFTNQWSISYGDRATLMIIRE